MRRYGFFSYARLDDEDHEGHISELRLRLERRTSGVLGDKKFRLYQDWKDIGFGQNWRRELDAALEDAAFLVAVITPHFFNSPECRKELEVFVERERRLGRGDLIYPLLYLWPDDDPRADDSGANVVFTRQWEDWRELRHESWTHPSVKKLLDRTANGLARGVKRYDTAPVAARPAAPPAPPPPPDAGPSPTPPAPRTSPPPASPSALTSPPPAVEHTPASPPVASSTAATPAPASPPVASPPPSTPAPASRRPAAHTPASPPVATPTPAAPPTVPQPAPEPTPGAILHTVDLPGAPLPLAWIPAGTCRMGSPDGVGREDEHPQHEVRLTVPFLAGVTPVTQAQWAAVAKEAGLSSAPSRFKGADHPVESISWYDAVRWCNALSQREGRPLAYRIGQGGEPEVVVDLRAPGYRLPTEAEWEHLCGAGMTSRWSFGESEGELGAHAWFDGNAGGQTHPTRQKRPNPWGLHDVHGNVWEWCGDSWPPRPYAVKSVTDPFQPPAPGSGRMVRGGSWNDGPVGCRSAFRSGNRAAAQDEDLGFRVVLPRPQ